MEILKHWKWYSKKEHIRRLIEVCASRSMIVAVDYDDTLVDYYTEDVNYSLINFLKKLQSDMGATLVLCTARGDVEHAISFCESLGLIFDAATYHELFDISTNRKVYYDILLDDKAGLDSALEILEQVYFECLES